MRGCRRILIRRCRSDEAGVLGFLNARESQPLDHNPTVEEGGVNRDGPAKFGPKKIRDFQMIFYFK